MHLFAVIDLEPALPDREIELRQPTPESQSKLTIEYSNVI